jgi:hypothetical protein
VITAKKELTGDAEFSSLSGYLRLCGEKDPFLLRDAALFIPH